MPRLSTSKSATAVATPVATLPDAPAAVVSTPGFSAQDVVVPAVTGEERKKHLTRVRTSEPIVELLKRALALAGGLKLEPEHVAIALLRDQGIKDPALEQALIGSAKAHGEGAGAGMSERTQALLVQASLRADAAASAKPSIADLQAALEAGNEGYASKFRGAVAEQKLDQLTGSGAGPASTVAKTFKPLGLEVLGSLAEDLVVRAAEGRIDSAVGRNKEVEQVLIALAKRQLGNPVLTGERGVGKTAIAEGLALMIAQGTAPKEFTNARILELNAGKLAAECAAAAGKGGSPAAVLDKLVAEIEQAKHQEPPVKIILFIDEIHTLMTGQAAAADLANHLKPYLSSGKLHILGATTREEYKKYIREDAALRDRFPEYVVNEPPKDEAVQMVLSNLDKYAQFHGVEIDASAAHMAVELSHHNGDMKLPRSAVDFLDLASSAVSQQLEAEPPAIRRLRGDIKDVRQAIKEAQTGDDDESERTRSKLTKRLNGFIGELSKLEAQAETEKALLTKLQQLGSTLQDSLRSPDATADEVKGLRSKIDEARKQLDALPERLYHLRVDGAAVASAVSARTGVPLDKIQTSDGAKYANLEQDLGKRVIGQDGAKLALADAVRLRRSGVGERKGPVGVHFFAGPTGVGKTELAKALADTCYNGKLIRFDCNDMAERHELAKMMGAPPGYVGFDGGSQLAEEIRAAGGHAVLLLDEVEKAHPDIFKRLMNLMDEGRLRDNSGKEVDCRDIHIIMTSNLGSDVFAQYAADGGYSDQQAVDSGFDSAFKHQVPAEVRARMTSVNIFDPLAKKDLPKILRVKLDAFEKRMLENQGITVGASAAFSEQIVKVGFQPAKGGRALNRAIEDLLQKPLAKDVLDKKFSNGSFVMFDLDAAGKTVIRAMTEDERAAATKAAG